MSENLNYKKVELSDLFKDREELVDFIPNENRFIDRKYFQEPINKTPINERLSKGEIPTDIMNDILGYRNENINIPYQSNDVTIPFSPTQPVTNVFPQIEIPSKSIKTKEKKIELKPKEIKKDLEIKEEKDFGNQEDSFETIIKRLKEENKEVQENENQIYKEAKKTANMVNFIGNLQSSLEKISSGLAMVKGDPNAGSSIKKDSEQIMNNAIKELDISHQQRKETKNLVKEAIEEKMLLGKVSDLDSRSTNSELRRKMLILTFGKDFDKLGIKKEELENMNVEQIDTLQKGLEKQTELSIKEKISENQLQKSLTQQDLYNKSLELREKKFERMESEQEELPNTVLKDLSSDAQLLTTIKSIQNDFKPIFVGPIEGRINSLKNQILNTPNGRIQFQQQAQRLLQQYMKSISGVAISEQEAQRLLASMPNIQTQPKQFLESLDGFEKEALNKLNTKVETYAPRYRGARKYKNDIDNYANIKGIKLEPSIFSEKPITQNVNEKKQTSQINYQEGDTKTIKGVQYKFTNGKWYPIEVKE